MAYYRIDPRKLFVIPLGYAPIFRVIGRQQAKGIAEKTFGIEGRFILALGSADPRKNLQGVIRAYQMLNDDLKSQYRLTLVLNHADVEERVNKEITRYELKDRVSLVMRPSQEELVALYNAADVFLFPSFVEGFGLPALEAMACGTPTIVSNRSSLPEVTGDAGLLVSPDDPQEIAAQLERVLTNQSLKIELSERGLRRAGHFSWQRTARMTLDVYRYAAEQDRVA